MNALGLCFHHLGLAVSDPRRATAFLHSLGYTAGGRMLDPAQNVWLALCTHPSMPAVEIIWPTETPGPLTALLRDRTEMIYHSAFTCDRVEDSLTAMRSAGHRVLAVSPATPAPLFHGNRVSFYQVAGFGLIELIETASS